MKRIAIIGAGQLGSRHLQGIAQSTFNISIEVVEPFDSSREIAQQRYKEMPDNDYVKEILFLETIDALSGSLDLVIVATGADARSKVVKELLASKQVDNLVLEKVLFQSVEEYAEIEMLLEKTNTKCWVNHPRRMYPFYQKIKNELQEATQISYSMQGGAWGLGCNALHFIDHLAFLADSENLRLNPEYLDQKIYDSKRKGFIEFNGLLVGGIDDHTFSLHANANGAPTILTIVSDTVSYKINESSGEIETAKADENWAWRKSQEKVVYYQSELSQILLEEIFIKKNVSLPTYAQAKALHIPFLNILLDKIEEITGKREKICPIT